MATTTATGTYTVTAILQSLIGLPAVTVTSPVPPAGASSTVALPAVTVTGQPASAVVALPLVTVTSPPSAGYTVPPGQFHLTADGVWRPFIVAHLGLDGVWRNLADGAVVTATVVAPPVTPPVTPPPASGLAAVSTAAPTYATGTTAFPIDPNRTTL